MYTVWRAVTMMSVVDLVVYDGTYLSVCWLSAACVSMRCASRCVREAAIEMPWRDREVSCGVHRLRRVTCNRGGSAADVHNLVRREITRRSSVHGRRDCRVPTLMISLVTYMRSVNAYFHMPTPGALGCFSLT